MRAPLLRFLFCLLLGFSFSVTVAFAQKENETVEHQEEIAQELPSEEAVVLHPKQVDGSFYEKRGSDTSMILAVYLFLLMIAVVIGLWVYNKKGGLKMNRLVTGNDLKIRETKALGNKQFLVVVEYGEQKMLLGVAPGVINHLCYLESSDITTDSELPIDQS